MRRRQICTISRFFTKLRLLNQRFTVPTVPTLLFVSLPFFISCKKGKRAIREALISPSSSIIPPKLLNGGKGILPASLFPSSSPLLTKPPRQWLLTPLFSLSYAYHSSLYYLLRTANLQFSKHDFSKKTLRFSKDVSLYRLFSMLLLGLRFS